MSKTTRLPHHVRDVLAAMFGLASLAGGQAYATCSFGTSGEPTLQNTFDTLLGAATVNVQTACLADGADSLWTTVNQLAGLDIKIELAGNASSNTFGLYDPANGNLFQIFEGNDSAGVGGTVRLVNSSGHWWVQVKDDNYSGVGDSTSWSTSPLQMVSTAALGFYLGAGANVFYSQTVRNADGIDHMYAYGELAGNPLYEGTYMLAWEDLFGGQDRDYQDFVVNLIDFTPVPIPAALWLLTSGLLGLGVISRRRTA